MTRLERKVQRLAGEIDGRELVVTLRPGPTPAIEVREKGRRSGYAVSVASLFTMLALREAERVIEARRAARRRKRGRAK